MGDGKKDRYGSFETKDHASQYWSLKKRSGEWHSLHNKAHGYVLDVEGHGTKNLSLPHLWGYHGKANQLWQLVSIGIPAPAYLIKLKDKQVQLVKTATERQQKTVRLALVTNLLKNRSKARHEALLAEKTKLTKAIITEQKVLAKKNNAAVKMIGTINS